MILRREFITLLGVAAAWPLAVRAQQGDRLRRIGVFMLLDENDPVAKAYVAAFTQALADLGWTDGRNARCASQNPAAFKRPLRLRPFNHRKPFGRWKALTHNGSDPLNARARTRRSNTAGRIMKLIGYPD